MDAFISRKRRHTSIDANASSPSALAAQPDNYEDSTEFKLALLASMHPDIAQDTLLEALLSSDGLVDTASAILAKDRATSFGQPKRAKTVGHQSTLASLVRSASGETPLSKPLTKKGKTLFLYSPQDIETHTPCSIIHNFLPAEEANALLTELLDESRTFEKEVFQLFDRTLESPHTMSFYVDSFKEVEEQKTTYTYNGSTIKDIRQTPPKMLSASTKVRQAVNNEIQRRIAQFYPNGEKLKYQDPTEWKPNTAFVNCYDGPQQSVGYHSDQLTYLGPRAVIGSLSLGVAREFRVRKIVPKDNNNEYYKPSFHPKFTPKCYCKVPVVLRCVQRKSENLGRYMWMCHAGYTPGQKGCTFFRWAEFDEDGEPPWKDKVGSSNTGG
ncbi:hypothetical protein E4T50_12832 [Aureobasidium sp. EXF-12298]|nr:hypothetical protein E4T50_12832 [Aureobasidium sp. EXF-12298]